MSVNVIHKKLFNHTSETASIPTREEIHEKYKWNLGDIYKNDDEWENDFAWVEQQVEGFKKFEGKLTCINGATQIRAGVIRPEIIIPQDVGDTGEAGTEISMEGLQPGLLVRIIREPFFGLIGKVVALPPELQTIDSESSVRVMVVELEDGGRVTIPRANVELIEE